ncbi:MAG TPA: hypothetical protein VN256_14335 [Pyrinomonadaceae bacterium]|nr:hypothetical protein [Pyrinomonadaceae bacterium]
MRSYHARVKQAVILTAVAPCLLAVLATPVLAQRGSRASAMERRSEEMNRRRDQLEREMLLRGVEAKSEKAAEKPAPQTVSQVKHDFERIQSIYNELVRALASNKPLDYKFVSDAAAEIKKCSSRLKSHLALPSSEEDGKTEKRQEEASDERIQPALLLLTTHIRSFVTNPLFETSGVLDVKLSSLASRDLKKIIELSDHIRKSADKINKPGN